MRIYTCRVEKSSDKLVKDFGCWADPPQSKMCEIYAMSDVWLRNSVSDRFNLPAMEATACRTPVVSTRTGRPEEVIVSEVDYAVTEVDAVVVLSHCAQTILRLAQPQWCCMFEAAFYTVLDSSRERSIDSFGTAFRQQQRNLRTNCAIEDDSL